MKTHAIIVSQTTHRVTLRFRKTFPGRELLSVFAISAAVFFATGAARAQDANRTTKVAKRLVELINAGDHAGIQTNFNRQMAAALPPEKSSEFFKEVKAQVGPFQRLGQPRVVGEGAIIVTECEKGSLHMQLTLDGTGNIFGLALTPRGTR